MEPSLQQQVQKRIAELPADVRQAIQSSDLSQKVQAIGKKRELHIDQMAKLEDEVLLVMLGFADPAEFEGNLVSALAIPVAQSIELAADVANEIFMPIRQSMREWTESQEARDDANAVSSAMPAAVKSAPIVPEPAVPAVIGPTTQAVAKPAVPPLSPDMHAAETIMAKTVVQVAPQTPAPAAPVDPAKPLSYKADPYREPVE